MNFTALPFTQTELAARNYPCDLARDDHVVVSLDAAVSGAGGAWGQDSTFDQYKLQRTHYHFRYRIQPYNGTVDDSVYQQFYMAPPPEYKINGNKIKLDCSDPSASLSYALNDRFSFKKYDKKTCLPRGNMIYACSDKRKWVPSIAMLHCNLLADRSDWNITVSSDQPNTGEGAKKAVDGDPRTIWHTRWQDNVPDHPHFIQIDMNKTIEMQGFTYLPRQDGLENGQIKEYEFYVSMDGSQWDKSASGSFARGNQPKKVIFEKTVTARYIKFVSLSEINGRNFTSIAEINVIQSPESNIPAGTR
jgi:beta-galactosidase